MKKRFIAGILVGVMALSLTACGNKNTKQEETTTATKQEETTKTQEETTTSQEKTTEEVKETTTEVSKEEVKKLTEVLNEVKDDVRAGTAGASIRSIKTASDILNWAVATTLSDEVIQSETNSWYASLSDDEKSFFMESYASVYSSYQSLIGPNAKQVVESADVEITGYPWSDKPVAAVESINTAVSKLK